MLFSFIITRYLEAFFYSIMLNKNLPREEQKETSYSQPFRYRNRPLFLSSGFKLIHVMPFFGDYMDERRLLTIPGPTIFDPSVLRSLSVGHLGHTSENFIRIFSEVLGNLRELLYADENYRPVVLAGSGTLAMEAGTSNFIKKDDNVLVVSNGVFGDRMVELLNKYPINVDALRVKEPGEVVDSNAVAEKLDQKEYGLVTVTHVDTSTAVRQDLVQVGRIVRKHDALLVVDGVCSVAGEEIRMKDWGIDVVLTGSQKALGVPAGLAILWLSPKALDRLSETKGKYSPYYMDLTKWIGIMESYEKLKAAYFATPAVNLIIGLHRSLELMFEEGIENRFRRHKNLSKAFRSGIQQLGLRLVAKSEDIAASTVTAAYLPENVELGEFRKEMLARNVVVAGGLYPSIKSNYFRVGHMGPINANDIVSVVAAIERSLKKLGYEVKPGDGVTATQRVLSDFNL